MTGPGTTYRREMIAAANARWASLRADVGAAQSVVAAILGGRSFTFDAPPDTPGLRRGRPRRRRGGGAALPGRGRRDGPR